MIEQVVACAVKGDTPPPELKIIWRCQRFGCLPDAGGYMDQDVELMDKGVLYEDVYNLTRKWRAVRNVKELTAEEARLFKLLRDWEVNL